MKNRLRVYWFFQFLGWIAFVLLNALFVSLKNSIDKEAGLSLIITLFAGLGLSHLYRYFILKLDWLRLNLTKILPRFLLGVFSVALVHYSLLELFSFLYDQERELLYNSIQVVVSILNIAFVYSIWSLIYFLVHFIENYKMEEIKSLKWEAALNTLELSRLKSQLNPHFVFNSLNSIRALVDHHPEKSKQAINQLANILRSGLQMNKKELIPLKEELQIVKDYLALEKIRYEERLEIDLRIAEELELTLFPPMMLQTLVENAIKHGISKLISGGKISLQVYRGHNCLVFLLINSGQLVANYGEEEKVGIANTLQRLKLLYGQENLFKIENFNEREVKVELIIPLNHESVNY
jgi:two-component system, LytTR family, sensor kinase